jgi:hypothetical protein
MRFMGIRHDIQDNWLDNPIAWREFITLFRQRGKWFWRVLYGLTLLVVVTPLFFNWSRHLDDAVSFIFGTLLLANIFIYPLVVVRTIMTANESVSRERRGYTWDLLMLTGVGTWRVVIGKWLGTLRFITRDYGWLFFLRISAFFWYVVQHSFYSYGWGADRNLLTLADANINWQPFMASIALMLAFTVVEMLFSSAIGVATAFFNWRSRTSGGIAIGVRVGLAIAIFFGTMYAVGYLRFDGSYPNYDDHVDQFIMTFALTFVDNGIMSSARIAAEDYLDVEDIGAIRLALYLNLLLYVVLTGIALEVARTVAHRVGVNNPGAPSVKNKRKNSIEEIRPLSATPERTVATQTGVNNAFGLPEPASYQAEVYHYQRRLGRMYLRLTRDNDTTYIRLSNVAYIEAPSGWKSADFHTAAPDEYEAFVREKGLTMNGLTAESMRLYVLDGQQPVRIVAGTAQILDELPLDI